MAVAIGVLVFGALAWADEVILDGLFVQGGLVRGKAPPGTAVRLDGAEVKVGPNGDFVLGFSRDEPDAATLTYRYADGTSDSVEMRIAQRAYDIERIDGLPPSTVTIPPEEIARRKRERGLVASARVIDSDGLQWQGDFVWPAVGRVSGVYGSQRILNGEPRSPHYGLDIAGPVDTPVVAPQGGRILLAEPDFLLEGGIVIIDHGFGIFSTLFHMQSVEVAVGDVVARGQRIGSIGQTGRATGPHVDWRVNWNAVRLDPGFLVSGDPTDQNSGEDR